MCVCARVCVCVCVDSLLKVSAAAIAAIAGDIRNWSVMKTSFNHIPFWLVIGVNVLSVVLFLWLLIIFFSKRNGCLACMLFSSW